MREQIEFFYFFFNLEINEQISKGIVIDLKYIMIIRTFSITPPSQFLAKFYV